MRFMHWVILILSLNLSQAFADDLQPFYSAQGREVQANFTSVFKTRYQSLDEFKAMADAEKNYFVNSQMEMTFKFLFGPLVTRDIGSPLRTTSVDVDWQNPRLGGDGFVYVSYKYAGTWIVNNQFLAGVSIPVPFNQRDLFTRNWKKCTDPAPDHSTESFYWYFWDPNRYGCEHKLNNEFQNVNVSFTNVTQMTTNTYPEYNRLFKENRLSMTFGFGYVVDPADPNPEKDGDQGMWAYRYFLNAVKSAFEGSLKDTPIYASDYRVERASRHIIGHKLEGKRNGRFFTVTVVASGAVDQMEIFAKSFAHDHDGFFGWFGHSRVGSGFDAANFRQMLSSEPSYYSVTSDYQLVYWAGCNSYSYYTLPFFAVKAQAFPADSMGTKNLDIIANGMPSLFSLNSQNAWTVFKALVQPEINTSYQQMVNEIENNANEQGTTALTVVLGDEDN